MADPLVSILVPNYNSGPYLAALCASVAAQTYPHFELLVLDDGSTDDSAAAIHEYAGDGRFHALRWPDNRGLNQAWFALLQRARGDYWCSPGADDVLERDFLEHRVQLLEANPQAVLAHGRTIEIGAESQPLASSTRPLELPAEMPAARMLQVLLQHNIINQPSTLVRLSLTRLVLPWFARTWRYAPDWYLWILHAALGAPFLWDPQPRLRYRVHGQSLTVDPAKRALREAEIRLVPLSALSAAAQYSDLAHQAWAHWGASLYRLWLRRCVKLKSLGALTGERVQLGVGAWRRGGSGRACWWAELLKQAPGMVRTTLRERRAQRVQRFPVSGLAAINDPLFH